MKTTYTYLETLTNDNTRKSANVLISKLNKYCEDNNISIENLTRENIDLFLKQNYSNSIVSSLYSAVCRLKHILLYFNNTAAMEFLNYDYIKETLSPKTDRLYTPYEVTDNIENLLNPQDRCLVLLCYLGLYDSDFKTIRNLKESDLEGNILNLPNGKFLVLNDYSLDIITSAINEVTYTPYLPNGRGQYEERYLKSNTSYIIRGIEASRTGDIISAISIKKRFTTFSEYLGDKDFTPIAVKNSKIVYDFVSKEYIENEGNEISQLTLIEYCKNNNLNCCVEQLNVIKKKMRDSIIEEIEDNLDFICR